MLPMNPFRLKLLAALACLLPLPASADEERVRERLAPPPAVGCERDRLSSYSGAVRDFTRGFRVDRLVLETDWGSREQFTLDRSDDAATIRFLLHGEAMHGDDWARVVTRAGKPLPGLRATAWVCGDPGNHVTIDWRPGAPSTTLE